MSKATEEHKRQLEEAMTQAEARYQEKLQEALNNSIL